MRGVVVALVVLIAGVLGSAGSSDARAVPAEMTVVCTPSGVATFSNRIHVRCTQSFSGITVFAAGTASVPDTAAAARYMTLATSAMVAGRNVRVTFDPADQAGATALGCQPTECRLLRGLEIK
jgi:hypothetical protein